MPTSVSHTARLAELALAFRAKHALLAELDQLLNWFRASERPIVDETDTAEEVRSLFQQANDALREIAQASEADVSAPLARIEAVLSDSLWDDANEQIAKLKADEEMQAAVL